MVKVVLPNASLATSKEELERGEAHEHLWCLPHCEQNIGQDEVPIPPLLIYHLPQHPFQRLIKSSDQTVCLRLVDGRLDMLNL